MKTTILLVIAILVVLGIGAYLMFFSAPAGPAPSDTPADQRAVTLFYYNPNQDKDADGIILCSERGLVPVYRKIPKSLTPIQDTIRLLLRGELTANEKAQGITTEFPLKGVELKGANLQNGSLTLELSDPAHRTSGGACRVNVLKAQVEATALQFSEVGSVRFIPENIFQP